MTDAQADAIPENSTNDDDAMTIATRQIERSGPGNIRVAVHARPPYVREFAVELAGGGNGVCVVVSPAHSTALLAAG